MGLLEDTYGPEVGQMMAQYGSLSPEIKQKALNDSLMNAGFAMLASNGLGATRNQSLGRALGAGGLAGMHSYNSYLDDAQQQQAQQMQMAGQMEKLIQQRKKAEMIAQFRNNLPEQDRQLFDVAPEDYLKNLPQFQKPQLVEIADPKEPLRTQKVWMRPGETQGTVAGLGSMPELLDPRIQAVKEKIAAAGAARQSIHLPPMESEEQKALGKDLAEQYSGLQKAGLTASGTMNNLNRMKSLLTGIETGKLTPASTEVSGVLDSLGIKIDPKLPQKQAAAALANELALRAKNSGGENMMPGAMSDPDRRFLVQMVPGLANTQGGNALIIETLQRKAKRDIDVARMAREYRQKNKTLNGFSEELAAWSEKNPLFEDLAPKAMQSNVRARADAIIGAQ